MSERIGKDNIREYLTAFADGELDAAQTLRVLDYIEEHPEGMQLVRTHQHLRLAADRTVRAHTPPTPENLRRRLETLASAAPATRSPRMRLVGRRWPAVAAACLVAGALIGRSLPGTGPFTPPAPTAPLAIDNAEPIPATTVAHATRVHADCSRLREGLHAAGYPRELAGLADAVTLDLGGDDPYPDLSGLGYRFVGAGPCADPLQDTVHLLYVSTAPGHQQNVSVFAQRNADQFPLEPGKLYVVSGPRSPFPMYAWETKQVVYFLIADSESTIRAARQAIAAAPALSASPGRATSLE